MEHDDRAGDGAFRVEHLRERMADRHLATVTRGQAQRHIAFMAALRHHRGTPRFESMQLARTLIDQPVDLRQRAPPGVFVTPSGQRLGNRIHEFDTPLAIDGDHAVIDRMQRHVRRRTHPMQIGFQAQGTPDQGMARDPGAGDHQHDGGREQQEQTASMLRYVCGDGRGTRTIAVEQALHRHLQHVVGLLFALDIQALRARDVVAGQRLQHVGLQIVHPAGGSGQFVQQQRIGAGFMSGAQRQDRRLPLPGERRKAALGRGTRGRRRADNDRPECSGTAARQGQRHLGSGSVRHANGRMACRHPRLPLHISDADAIEHQQGQQDRGENPRHGSRRDAMEPSFGHLALHRLARVCGRSG